MRKIEKQGPSVLITTSTRRLGEQLMSRLFVLDVPDDAEQLRKALAAQAQIEIYGVPEANNSLIALQAYLQQKAPWDVVVPFAPALAEGIGRSVINPRVLRDYQKLISLVKAVAVLNCEKRERGKDGRC